MTLSEGYNFIFDAIFQTFPSPKNKYFLVFW